MRDVVFSFFICQSSTFSYSFYATQCKPRGTLLRNKIEKFCIVFFMSVNASEPLHKQIRDKELLRDLLPSNQMLAACPVYIHSFL